MSRSRFSPHRSELPVFLALGLFALVHIYSDYRFEVPSFWHVVNGCSSLDCTALYLGKPIAIWSAGFLAAYLASTVLRRILYPRLALARRFPRVFYPPKDVTVALVAVTAFSLVVWLASVYKLLYTAVGLAIFYTLYFPILNVSLLREPLKETALYSGIVPEAMAIPFLIAQVAWWYVLAYGLVGGYQRVKKVTSE